MQTWKSSTATRRRCNESSSRARHTVMTRKNMKKSLTRRLRTTWKKTKMSNLRKAKMRSTQVKMNRWLSLQKKNRRQQ